MALAIIFDQDEDGKGRSGDTTTSSSTSGPDTTTTSSTSLRRSPPVVTALSPIADAYANEGAASSNFGASSSLFSRGALGGVSYLRFDFPAQPEGRKLTSAELRIATTTLTEAGSGEPHSVWRASDAWDELELTWNNRPPVGPELLGVIEAPEREKVYRTNLDVSELQTLLGRQATLAITNKSSSMADDLWFWSRSFEGKDRVPELILTFS